MIAFEALFFKRDERGENRHKLAVRTARLLSQDYTDRKGIMKEMMDFYDRRSDVVHGKRISLDSKFIDKIDNYLRQSIKHFVQNSQTLSHDEDIARLDLE